MVTSKPSFSKPVLGAGGPKAVDPAANKINTKPFDQIKPKVEEPSFTEKYGLKPVEEKSNVPPWLTSMEDKKDEKPANNKSPFEYNQQPSIKRQDTNE